MAERVTGRLLTAGFEDAARNVGAAMARFTESIQATLSKINETLATTPEARAYADFIADGGDPRFIEAVEERFGVTHEDGLL